MSKAGKGIIGIGLDCSFGRTSNTRKGVRSFWWTSHETRMQENTSIAFYKIGTYFGGVDKVLRCVGEVGMPHKLL